MNCLETFASLRVFSPTLSLEAISAALGVAPSTAKPIEPASRYRPRREMNFWSWRSDRAVTSRDGLEHIRAIVQLLDGKQHTLAELTAAGCQIDICCYYVSPGQGGPQLDVATLRALAELGLEIWWDVYFGHAQDYNPGMATLSVIDT